MDCSWNRRGGNANSSSNNLDIEFSFLDEKNLNFCQDAPSRQEIHKSRLMDRDGYFHQSLGRWNIKRIKTSRLGALLYVSDPFHTVVNSSTPRVIVYFLWMYLIVTVVYGGFYMLVDSSCKLGIVSFADSLYFSIETLMTIGYGAQGGDIYFNGCYSPLLLIISQSLIGIFIDTVAIGIIFQRLSRAQSRAVTIIFSNTACIRRIRGSLYLMFQVCELRKHQLIEAHVRCYAIRKEKQPDGSIFFQTYPLRLQHPNDETGALLLMALPSVVVHRLDAWSALMPPRPISENLHRHNPSYTYLFPDLIGRVSDVESGNREAHEGELDPPFAVGDLDTTPISQATHSSEQDKILKYLEETEVEIVVLVEGIDAPTSATVQARHSYKVQEIQFDHTFANCVHVGEDGTTTINFNKFHDVVPTSHDTIVVHGSYC